MAGLEQAQNVEDGEIVTPQKAMIETYFEGFRRGDHQQILDCLTDDVVWDLPGFAHLTGKVAFDREIENDAFVGRPTLIVDRLVEEGDTVVAIGSGEASRKDGERFPFAFSDAFTFSDGKIRCVESYLVALERGK